MKLTEYIESGGRGAAKRLAEAISCTPTEVSDWLNDKRPVPHARCVAIEQATAGAVTRQDLRPDDYGKLWPELAESTTNPEQTAQPGQAA